MRTIEEVLKCLKSDCRGCERENYASCDVEEYTIELLEGLLDKQEKGLLVELPCKVGDKVWLKVNDYLTTTAKVVAIRFEQDGVLIKLQYFIENCNDESKMEIRYWYVDFNDFGKKVFLTEDEAMPKPVRSPNEI